MDNYDFLFESELNEKAKSKSQRRLFGMALAYKRGELSASKASDEVKLLSDTLSEEKLKEFAGTKQKSKSRKTGHMRNNIPYKVRKKKPKKKDDSV